jgi:hypothetical protein
MPNKTDLKMQRLTDTRLLASPKWNKDSRACFCVRDVSLDSIFLRPTDAMHGIVNERLVRHFFVPKLFDGNVYEKATVPSFACGFKFHNR